MSKNIKRIALSVLCAILLACAVTIGVLFGTKTNKPNGGIADSGNNTVQGGNSASGAAGSLGTNNTTDYVVSLSGSATDMANQWKTAMGYSGSVTVVLKDNWTASGGSFGTCTGSEVGFGSTGGLVIPSNKTVVINMNGFNLNRGLGSATTDGAVITTSSSSTLVINGPGTISGGYNVKAGGGGGIASSGDVTLNGVTVSGNYAGWGAALDSDTIAGTNIYLSDVDINNNTNTDDSNGFSTVYVGMGNLYLYSGKIYNNHGGGAIAIDMNGTFEMTGGVVDNNTSNGTGGGVYVGNSSTFNMRAGTISNNTTNKNGGGVYVCTSSFFNMFGGIISGNTANSSYNGAGVHINVGTFNLSGGTISGNICNGLGAVGITSGTINMSGGNIINNTSCSWGISGNTATINLTGGVISGNPNGLSYSANMTLNIGGPVRITGNTTSNLHIASGKKINVTGALVSSNSNDATIGVTATANQVITTNFLANFGGTSDTALGRILVPDNASQQIVRCLSNGTVNSNYYSNNELKITAGTTDKISWTVTVNGTQQTVSNGLLTCYYGDVISAATASYGGVTVTWSASVQGFNGNSTTFTDDIVVFGQDSTVNSLKNVGVYNFFTTYGQNSIYTDTTAYRSICVEILPRPITVTIDDKSSKFGEQLATLTGNITGGTLASGDSLNDLGITYTKAAGDSVGKYSITGTATNKNYDVTFVNGTYEVTSQDVWVTINDQYATYGSKYYALTKTENNTPWAAVGAITNENGQDIDSEGYPVDSDGDRIDDNGNKLYNGGWRYTDNTPTKFLASDIASSTRYPFTIKCSGTGFTDITDTANTAYIAVGKYFISYTASPNYNITFTSNNTNGAADTQGVYDIQGAAITVKSASVYDSTDLYDSKDYTGSAINIQIPSGAIELKGDTTAATVKYVVFESTDTNIPATDPKADDPTFWTTALTAPTQTNAGTYKVYSLIKATNHKDTVYIWTFKIGASGAEFELSVQHGGVDVAADASGAYKVTYDDTKAVTASIKFTTSGVNANNCPVVFYYKGTGTYGSPATNNTYGTATDPDYQDNSGTDDNNNPRNLGNSNGPKEVGTYIATVIIDPTKTSGYELDSSCSQTITFTIEPKTVNLPTTSPASLTYNGNDQTISYVYDAKAVKEITSADTANFTSLSEVISGTTKNYKDLTFGSTATSGNNKTTKFTAKNAGDYGVKFELSSTRNYKWNVTDTTKEYQPQIVSYTIKAVELQIVLAPPTGQSSFTWGLGTTGDITVKSLTGVLQSDGTNDDPVTFNVSYYLKPTSGSPSTPGVEYSDMAYDDIKFDVSKFTATGTYVIWIQLADDSAGDDVNCNYTFASTDTNFNPAVENVFVQPVTISSGSVDVSGLKWGWSQDGSIPAEIDSTTKLVYTYDKTAGAAKDYTVTLLDGTNGTTNSIPAYLQVQSFNSNGFTNGYKDNEKSDVNFDEINQTVISYKAVVRLEIINDSNNYRDNYKFTTGNTAYTCISAYEAEVEFSWTIYPQEIDFSDVEWQFADTLIGEKDTSVKWTKYDTSAVGGQPEYTGNFIFVKIDETIFTDLGLSYTYDSSDASTNDIFVNYTSTNKQRDAVDSNGNPVTKNTVATITLNNHNFTLPSSKNPYQETFNWRVLKKQIYISGWTGTKAIVGSDGSGGTKAFTFPMPSVTKRGSTDTTDYSGMFEYVFDYILPDQSSIAGKTEAQMIADVYPVATPNVPVEGTIYVKLKDAYAKDYEINANSPMSASFRVGDSKIVITMAFGGTHTTYGDGGDFTITANEEGVDKTATFGSGIQVTATDAAGQVKSFTLGDIANSGILGFLENAGTYKFEFELDTQYTGTYALYVSELDYTVARKEIVVPQVIKALTFDGTDLVFTDHLDNQYKTNLALIDVTGDTLGRNVISGGYQVTLALNDENYCWVLPASAASTAKGSVKITLATDTVETSVELSSDAVRAVYSWNVAPLTIDSSKMWNNGQLKLTPELATLVNNGDITIKYNYYDTDGMLVGDSESGFEPQGGVSYRIEAVLGGQDGENGNVVFVSSDGTIAGNTSDQVVYTAPKTGMAKFKDALTKKYMGMPLWLWLVIGLGILLFLIILICIIVAAAKKKKKKKEEEAAKAEKEEAKAAAAAAAAAPMLAMSASMADEKAKLEAEKAKMEAELAKAKMEAEAEAARAKAQAEAEAAKAKAQAELDLQKAKAEAEIAKMRAEAEAQNKQAQQAQQPAQQPMPQPQYQQQPQYMPQPQFMPMPQPQYMPQPQPVPQQNSSNSSVEHMLMEMKAQQAISEAKNEAQFRIMSAENKAAQEVAEAKAQARQNGNQQMPQYPPYMGMGMGMMNPMMGMGMSMPAMSLGYSQPQAQQQNNGNAPVILTIGPNGEVKQISAQPVVQQPQVQPILINLGGQPQMQQPVMQEQTPAAPAPQSADSTQPLSAQYPPGAVVTTTTTVDTTKNTDSPELRRRRNTDNDVFDIDGFYDKFDGNI